MGASGAMMLGVGEASKGISGFAQGYSQAAAHEAMGEYRARMLKLNAEISDYAAEDAIRRGEREVEVYSRRVKQLLGSQKAAAAASGVAVGEGSVAEIAEDTAVLAAEDVVMIRSNAWREAWGHRQQALDYRGQAEMTRISSSFQAGQSRLQGWMGLIGHGASAYGQFSHSKATTAAANKIAGQDAARNYFRGSAEGSVGGARKSIGLDGPDGLSHSGTGPGKWGRMRDGSHGYGYRSIWS